MRRTLAAHLSLVWVAKLSGAQDAKATWAACTSKLQEVSTPLQWKRQQVLKCVNNRGVAGQQSAAAEQTDVDFEETQDRTYAIARILKDTVVIRCKQLAARQS